MFVISNWALVYFFIYTVRIKGWSFGFGAVTSMIGKVGGAIKGPINKATERKRQKDEEEVEEKVEKEMA